MSTNCHIAILNDDGSYDYIYCHWDGYPSHSGKILFEYYRTPEIVRELISLGDISSLGKRIHPIAMDSNREPHSWENREEGVTVFYSRDRKDPNTGPEKGTLSDVACQAYSYIYKEGEWFLYRGKGYQRLAELFPATAKRLAGEG